MRQLLQLLWATLWLLVSPAGAVTSEVIFIDPFELPALNIQDVTLIEGNSGTSAMAFTVLLSEATNETVTFDYATTPASAHDGEDYTGVSGQGSIGSGTLQATIEVAVGGDICVEDDESLTLTISNPSSNAILGRALGTGTIQTDDPLPVMDLSVDPPLIEGDTGTTQINFRILLDKMSCTEVIVQHGTADVSATSVEDYVALSGPLTIPAFTSHLDFNVTTNGDICVETDETFEVTLSNPTSNVMLGNASATGVIQNDDPLPILDIAPASENEGDSASAEMLFGLTLDRQSCTETTVDYATSDLTASTADGDYVGESGSVFIPAFTSTGSIGIIFNGDLTIEDNETFNVSLLDAEPNIQLGTASATGTLINDDFFAAPSAPLLNDTGVNTCSNDLVNDLSCNDIGDGTADFPGQDAEFGRDFTADIDADGYAGFAFTKLDSQGVPLPDQSLDYTTSPWRCIRDEVTGLIWETKAADSGLQDYLWTYSWLNSTGFNDGGNRGVPDTGECSSDSACDTESYAAAINSLGLCGFSNWRLPSRTELLSIVHYGAQIPPVVESSFFPHTAGIYWTSDFGLPATGIRVVDFETGGSRVDPHGDSHAVRLVRGEQP